ncbi:MAG: thioesterase family protein [Acidobacteria bacterium]|nr:thioesterase family protein [Acidobacteriota bacterium]
MAFKYSCPVEVRFRDCDPMGHANNAVYLTYLEVARFAYWRDVCGGRGWGDIKFIMARVEVDYKAPAEQGNVLDVRLGITSFGRTSFVFKYELLDQHNRLIATARTVQVMYDYATSKPVPVLQGFKDRVSAFEGVTS